MESEEGTAKTQRTPRLRRELSRSRSVISISGCYLTSVPVRLHRVFLKKLITGLIIESSDGALSS